MSMQHRPKCRALVPSKLFNFKTISKAKKPQIFRLEALYLFGGPYATKLELLYG